MGELPRARFRPSERLTTAADYRRVFRSGHRLDGPLFLLVAVARERGGHRIGIAASRRVGGAVARNRAKRVLRECFRRNKAGAGRFFDMVLVPKREIVERTMAEVEREFRERLRRLASRADRARPRPAPPD